MKAAAILTLILAIIIGWWAIADFEENVKQEQFVRFGGTLADVRRYEDLERQDGLVVILACGALIASVVMFSKAKKDAPKPSTSETSGPEK